MHGEPSDSEAVMVFGKEKGGQARLPYVYQVLSFTAWGTGQDLTPSLPQVSWAIHCKIQDLTLAVIQNTSEES